MPTAFFPSELKPGHTPEDYASFLAEFEYPLVAGIPSIRTQRKYHIIRSVDSHVEKPFINLGIVEFTTLNEYLADLQSHPAVAAITGQLQHLIELERMIGTYGSVVPNHVARPHSETELIVFLSAKRKPGVTEADYRNWLVYQYYPLYGSLQSVSSLDLFSMEGVAFNATHKSYDHVTLLYIHDVESFLHQSKHHRGARAINDQMNQFFQIPVVSHVIGRFIPPGVSHADANTAPDPGREIVAALKELTSRLG